MAGIICWERTKSINFTKENEFHCKFNKAIDLNNKNAAKGRQVHWTKFTDRINIRLQAIKQKIKSNVIIDLKKWSISNNKYGKSIDMST